MFEADSSYKRGIPCPISGLSKSYGSSNQLYGINLVALDGMSPGRPGVSVRADGLAEKTARL